MFGFYLARCCTGHMHVLSILTSCHCLLPLGLKIFLSLFPGLDNNNKAYLEKDSLDYEEKTRPRLWNCWLKEHNTFLHKDLEYKSERGWT